MTESQSDRDRGTSTTPTLAEDLNFVNAEPQGPTAETDEVQGDSGDAESTEASKFNLGGMIGEVELDADGGAHLTESQLKQTKGDLDFHRKANTQANQRMADIERKLDTIVQASVKQNATAQEQSNAERAKASAKELRKAIDSGDDEAVDAALDAAVEARMITKTEAKKAQVEERQPRSAAQVAESDKSTVSAELSEEGLEFSQEQLQPITSRAVEVYAELKAQNPGVADAKLVNRAVRKAHNELTSSKPSKKPRSQTRTTASGPSAGEFDGAPNDAPSGRRRRPAGDMHQFD